MALSSSALKKAPPPGEMMPDESTSLSRLERELHTSFYASRLPSGSVRFRHALMERLDDFCPCTQEVSEPKKPVVVVGPPGSGKSTLLAAWLQRHRKSLQRRPKDLKIDEFVFLHVVGCTRSSVFMRELLTRLTTEVMTYFNLPRPKNFDPGRLAWELPRLLEVAASRGSRVLIIIDGLHRLRDDSGATTLKWLPLIFPPNVYVICSSTCLPPALGEVVSMVRRDEATCDGTCSNLKKKTSFLIKQGFLQQQQEEDPPEVGGRRNSTRKATTSVEAKIKKRVLFELRRRQWTLWHVTCISPSIRASILRNNLVLLDMKRHACDSDDDIENALVATVLENVGDDATALPPTKPRDLLDLFPAQHDELDRVPTNALMLATLLRALECSAGRGFDVWRLHRQWLDAATLGATQEHSDDASAPLFDAVLETWEQGHKSTKNDRSKARKMSLVAGATTMKILLERQQQQKADDSDDDYGEDFEDEEHVVSEASPPSAEAPVAAPDDDDALLLVPEYLLGGATEEVPGLGSLLGDALAFLYVARYGLREEELWALLSKLDFDRKRKAQERIMAAKVRAQESRKKKEVVLTRKKVAEAPAPAVEDVLDDDLVALLDAAEKDDDAPLAHKVLPTLLRALGVIHDDVARVLVLPLESEALRAVVKRRYIDDGPMRGTRVDDDDSFEEENDEKKKMSLPRKRSKKTGDVTGGDRWHARLAAYFAREEPSRRRAEELPWHLKHCRQWTSLCFTLANIPTFETMFHGSPQMQLELQEYWRLLTDGPLYVTRKAAQDAALAESTEQQQVLRLLDGDFGHCESEAKRRRERLQQQCATFDVVDAYNAAVEHWQQTENPPTHKVAQILTNIGDFLLDFSDRIQPPAPFLRNHLDWRRLRDLGVFHRPFEKAQQAALPNKTASALSSPPKRPLSPLLSQDGSNANFSTKWCTGTVYSRALSDIGWDKANTHYAFSEDEVCTGGHPSGIFDDDEDNVSKKTVASIVSVSDLLANLRGTDEPPRASKVRNYDTRGVPYFYERWMWIQFPWFALAHSTSVSWTVGRKYTASADQQRRSSETTFSSDNNNNNNNNSQQQQQLQDVPLERPPATKAAKAAASAVQVVDFTAERDRRYWQVKKRDPLADPVVLLSDRRMRSRLKAGGLRLLTETDMDKLRLEALSMSAPFEHPYDDDDQDDDDNNQEQPPEADSLQKQQQKQHHPSTDDDLLTEVVRSAPKSVLKKERFARWRPPRRMRWKPSITEAGPQSSTASSSHQSRHSVEPFSASSLRSQRAGTRFPSAVLHHDSASMHRSRSYDVLGERAATRFGGISEPVLLKDVATMRELESLEGGQKTGPFPSTLADRAVNSASRKVERLRRCLDDMVACRKARKAGLKSMQSNLTDRESTDAYCSAEIESGETALATLDARLASVRTALAESAALAAFNDVIAQAAAEARPTRGAQRLQVVEDQLELARAQAADLLTKRRELLDGAKDIQETHVPQLKRERKKWIAMRRVARDRRRLVEASVDALTHELWPGQHKKKNRLVDYAALSSSSSLLLKRDDDDVSKRDTDGRDLYDRTLDRAIESRSGLTSASQRQKSAALRVIAKTGEIVSRPRTASGSRTISEEAEEANSFENMSNSAVMEHLVLTTGSNDPTIIAEEFKSMQEVQASLAEQHKLHVERLSLLEGVFAVMQAKIEDLRISGLSKRKQMVSTSAKGYFVDSSSQPDQKESDMSSRRLDALLFEAEIKLRRTERNAAQVGGPVAPACSGILHLARFVEAYLSKTKDERIVPMLCPELTLLTAVSDDAHSAVCSLLEQCAASIVSVRDALAADRGLKSEDVVAVILEENKGKRKAPKAKAPRTAPRNKYVDQAEENRSDLIGQLDESDLVFSSNVVADPPLRVATAQEKEEKFDRSLCDSSDPFEFADPEPDERTAALFIDEGLQKRAKTALRRANMSANLKQGSRAPLGLAMHEAKQLLPEADRRTPKKTAVRSLTRDDLKVASKRRIAEVDALMAAQQAQEDPDGLLQDFASD